VGIRAGRFVCFVLTLERCCKREGSQLVDHVCWTMGGEVRRVGLRAGRFVDWTTSGQVRGSIGIPKTSLSMYLV